MKKPRKPTRPELRVRISLEVFRAAKLASVRSGVPLPNVVETALARLDVIKREMVAGQ